MASDAVAGYAVLAMMGLTLVGAIKLFGLTRVVLAILGLALLAVAVAFGGFRALSCRRS